VLVQAPLQAEIAEGTSEADAAAALAAAGLAPPLLCKPLWTDGRDGSHKLAVLHDLEALGRLLRGAVCSEFKPPLVVQQFVEHGGVLFKVRAFEGGGREGRGGEGGRVQVMCAGCKQKRGAGHWSVTGCLGVGVPVAGVCGGGGGQKSMGKYMTAGNDV
jgi:hypothetical protein